MHSPLMRAHQGYPSLRPICRTRNLDSGNGVLPASSFFNAHFTLGQAMKDAGYSATWFGKQHLDNCLLNPDQAGSAITWPPDTGQGMTEPGRNAAPKPAVCMQCNGTGMQDCSATVSGYPPEAVTWPLHRARQHPLLHPQPDGSAAVYLLAHQPSAPPVQHC